MRFAIRSAMALAAAAVVLAVVTMRPTPAAAPDADVEALKAKIAALEGLIPDQAHIMADVGEHYTNLWFAGRAGNWPLADFYLSETRSHLRWAVRRIPVRKDNQGKEVQLEKILEAFENGQITGLKKTIDAKDGAEFERVYKQTLEMCYSCHKASDKPYLRPQVPTEPASRVMNFDPRAEWPQ